MGKLKARVSGGIGKYKKGILNISRKDLREIKNTNNYENLKKSYNL